MTDGAPDDDAEEVRLRVAAEPGNARLIRLTVTALASRMAYSYDEIEDLRIAVGEVGGILLGQGQGSGSDSGAANSADEVGRPVGLVEVVCTVWEDALRVATTRSPAEPHPEVTELNRQILVSVADEVEFDLDGPNPVITFTKRRRT